MAGKYAKLKTKQIPVYQHEGGFQQKIEEFKAQYLKGENSQSPSLIAMSFNDLWEQKQSLEAQISEINVKLEALSQLGVKRMDDLNMEKFTLPDGTPVWQKYEIYVSIPGKRGTPEREENEAELYAWLKKKKLLSLRKLMLPHQTLKALTGELLLDGKPSPDGVKVSFKTSLCVTGRGAGSNGDSDSE